mmetsp:Transcript_56163/g.114855  ORF Transcript_56163/g.114855 Transcript_56163/m.114855 type:complete len:108 (-) Transcript_56163:239-562(-)|eukprot:CAMPEP_0181295862 /NCGR_PEP_ID=MMETSP1101-20121128/4379_1 /TAXON_ID=46948 /ORGANISM="Rhodomonas abbreviata, Strain Caron Lab Isolate" /LENGTH=107 /DNA_ID=CAMNT_0023400653 /DNA_START=228 /DNA_END=551 /DNA_ORIENTATION=+
MKIESRTLFIYGFVGALFVLLAVVLATTPNPTWMNDTDPYTLSGDRSDEDALRGRNSFEDHHSSQLALKTSAMHVPLSTHQLRAVVDARRKHKAFFQRGDRVFKTGA